MNSSLVCIIIRLPVFTQRRCDQLALAHTRPVRSWCGAAVVLVCSGVFWCVLFHHCLEPHTHSHPSSSEEHLGCFRFLGGVSNAILGRRAASLRKHTSVSPGRMLSSRTSDLQGPHAPTSVAVAKLATLLLTPSGKG